MQKMKNYSYDELKNYVENSKGYVAVVMIADHCDNCTKLENYVNANLVPKYPDIEFLSFKTDDIPLFAPPLLPSIIFFKNGLRDHEGHGFPEPPETIDKVIDWLVSSNKK